MSDASRQPTATEPIAQANGGRAPLLPLADQGFGVLMKHTAEDVARLVEQELELWKREIELEVERAKATFIIGAVGATGALLTLLSATATAVLVVSLVLPSWAAALVVTAAVAVVGTVGLGLARKRFDDRSPLTRITESLTRDDVEAGREPP